VFPELAPFTSMALTWSLGAVFWVTSGSMVSIVEVKVMKSIMTSVFNPNNSHLELLTSEHFRTMGFYKTC